jgi:hypothetical protein
VGRLNKNVNFLNTFNKQPSLINTASAGTIRRIAGIRNNPNINEATRQKAAKLLNRGLAPSGAYKKYIVAPNNRNVVVIRANIGEPWNFQNAANSAKYTLNNRLKNTPSISIRNVNLDTGNLFKQEN